MTVQLGQSDLVGTLRGWAIRVQILHPGRAYPTPELRRLAFKHGYRAFEDAGLVTPLPLAR